MSKTVETSSSKADLSFVETTKGEKKFDRAAYAKYVNDLGWKDFLSTPFNGEVVPVQVTLETPDNPMSRSSFDSKCFTRYTHARINTFDQGGIMRIYMQDVPAIIAALTKVQEGYKAIIEAGERDFPTIPGFEEWKALQDKSNDYFNEACCS